MKDCLSLYRTLARKYPQTTPQDAVKLAYQSVYGCGHLIDSENSARVREYLARENADFADREWFTEDIGCKALSWRRARGGCFHAVFAQRRTGRTFFPR